MRLRATDGLCLALAMLWLGVHSASSLAQSDPNDSLKPRRVSLEPRDDVEQQTDVVYAAYGERQVKLDLFLPRNEETGRSAVVVVHGGGWLQGDRTRFHALAQALAARGFVTAAIEYRLGGEARFPAAIHDCNAAVRWLRANAERLRVDPQKIGAVGGSAGGHLVALMAAAPQVASLQGDGGNVDQSSALQAAVVMAGPLELTTGSVAERSRTGGDSSNANRWFGKTIDEAPELYELASPYTHLSERTPPMLFMAGEFDQPQRNVASRDRLRSFKVKTDVFAYADGKHGCWNQHPWFEPMVDDMDAFLSEALKKSPRADDTRPLAMPWGELHRLADRLELRLASLPESASGVSINVPRFNNPVGPIFIKGDESKKPLTLKPGLTDWTIELPKSVAAGESDMTIVVETVGRPYLPTLPRIVSSAAEATLL
ncbi:MAG: alpha/beta hydrolase [Pirellulaceae bacterium]